jgi:hypothetical protein
MRKAEIIAISDRLMISNPKVTRVVYIEVRTQNIP